MPDFANLTLLEVVSTLVLITAVDVVTAIVLAIIRGDFSLAYVAVWLQSHTVKRAFPIFALGLVGVGVPGIVPEIPLAFGAALAGLAAYAGETIKSLMDTVSTTTPNKPTDETPVPPETA